MSDLQYIGLLGTVTLVGYFLERRLDTLIRVAMQIRDRQHPP